ncbi:MAG TPA: carboxylating nicotinate-nucleotide diphosphorylase, partial [Actinomycetota bacterium]|nr:carboxylating nicotinate-nucleotide diphosphorylase [Actinomycetota bacterium]
MTPPMNDDLKIDPGTLKLLVQRALIEDLADAGDVTSDNILAPNQTARARILAKSAGVLAGRPVADAVFRKMDEALEISWLVDDGARLEPGAVVAELSGLAHSIMAAERVALNFLQHLSGVATLTAAFVEQCTPHGVQLLCTRKTIPGMRAVQRYAVAAGGGSLHREGLYDAILIKTNHCKVAGGIAEAVRRAKALSSLEVEVEVRNLDELREAAEAGAERVLLDNADLVTVGEAVRSKPEWPFLEVSGGVSLESIGGIAALRPDAISVGRITH